MMFYSRESQSVPELKVNDHTLFSAPVGEAIQANYAVHDGQSSRPRTNNHTQFQTLESD